MKLRGFNKKNNSLSKILKIIDFYKMKTINYKCD